MLTTTRSKEGHPPVLLSYCMLQLLSRGVHFPRRKAAGNISITVQYTDYTERNTQISTEQT